MKTGALLVIVAATSGAQGPVVELSDARISAAALFPGADASIDLGPAPAPGARRRVTEAQLRRWANLAGVAPDGLPAAVTLTRKMRRWSAEEASERARALLAAEAGLALENLGVALSAFAAAEIPAGTLEWSLAGALPPLGRPVRLSLRWRDGGGRSGVESFQATVTARAPAQVASSDIPAGVRVEDAPLRLQEIDLASLRDVQVVNLQQDQVLSLKRPLNKGRPLTGGILERRPEVERGAVVELVLATGPIRLWAPGRAEGAGSTGDLIPFRNLATNQRVLARVTGAKAAEVSVR